MLHRNDESRGVARVRGALARHPVFGGAGLFAGAPNIERVDRLVQAIAAQHGKRNAVLDETVALVDARLELTRRKAALAGRAIQPGDERGGCISGSSSRPTRPSRESTSSVAG